ncbi:MAG: hypothetical protein D3925_16290 [Candidatus Electrothrix sp. AR5]|nr:hypothetical protein [Candidatus Electrothrix sp. AR5]
MAEKRVYSWKIRASPNLLTRFGDFFCLHLRAVYIIQGGFAMTANEQAYCKITLFLLTDWDSFQIVMRGCLRRMERKETAQGTTNRATHRPGRP